MSAPGKLCFIVIQNLLSNSYLLVFSAFVSTVDVSYQRVYLGAGFDYTRLEPCTVARIGQKKI